MLVCAGACVRLDRQDHNSYIYARISKLFDTVVVLEEEKCRLKHFLGRLKAKVTLQGRIN